METATTGQKIRALRNFLNKTQEEFATLIETSREQLNYIENDKRQISILNLEKICDYLGIDLEDFFNSDDIISNISIAKAFRSEDLTLKDLQSIMSFSRIIANYKNIERLINGK